MSGGGGGGILHRSLLLQTCAVPKGIVLIVFDMFGSVLGTEGCLLFRQSQTC